MELKIRVARQSDARGIAEVHIKTWQIAYKDQLPQEYLKSLSVAKKLEKWKKKILSCGNQSKIFVAEELSEIVGFCHFGLSKDADANTKTGELYAIYVDPEHQECGVGSKLMTKALQWFKQQNFSKATLWVLDSNEKTKKFYESKGWKKQNKNKIEEKKGIRLNEVLYSIKLN